MLSVDFSLALTDRTGKLFLGREIIDALGPRVGRIRYGRLSAMPNSDPLRRIAGRLHRIELKVRLRWLPPPVTPLPPGTRPPMLHLDPLSVVRCRMSGEDIVLCHDVGPITHPNYFAPGVGRDYQSAYDRIRHARPHMVFVSESSRAEFHRLYGTEFASSTVIYIPVRPGLQGGRMQRPGGIGERFLLTAGNIGTRKNQLRSIEGFARSGLAAEGWQYILVGGNEPGAGPALDLAARTPGVRMPGYVDDAELRWLYSHAGGFVLMSLLEGFGMPIIEAGARGLCTLVSQGGVLAEVGGPAAFLADPLDQDAIGEGMRQLAGISPPERAGRLAATQAHLRRFEAGPIWDRWCATVDRALGAGAR